MEITVQLKMGFAARAAAVVLLALAGITAATSGASASTSAGVAKSCSGHGTNATCEAEAVLSAPLSMSFTITASSNQTVAFGYDDECFQGTGKASAQGSGSGITPLTLTVKHAYTHPGTCVIAVDGQLLGGGTGIHIVINSPAVAAPAVKGAAGGCVNDAGDSSANGTKIVLWSCNGQGPQDWAYTKDKLVHSGRCLTDPGNGGPGAGLILNGCSSAPDDLWVRHSNGEYVITIPGGQLCLTAPAAAKKGTQLIASICQNTTSQHWTLP
jgi:hypothetical protein